MQLQLSTFLVVYKHYFWVDVMTGEDVKMVLPRKKLTK